MIERLLVGWGIFVLVVYVIMVIDVMAYNRRVVVFWGRWFKKLTEEE